MTARTGVPPLDTAPRPRTETSHLYQEGMVAGVIGAAVVAVWFLILDALAGRPLYTPTVLGTALFGRGALGDPALIAPAPGMVAMFTWVHGLVFVVLGGVASRLLGLAERNPSFGFGVLLLFVVFQAGFMAATLVFAAPVLRALAWPAILGANLLAAAAMAGYFWRRHPQLRVSP